MMMDAFEDFCVSDITLISGVRPSGRTIDHSMVGRSNNGILFIFCGEACFWMQNKQQITVKTGELLFIPKACKYIMQYTAPSTTFVLINLEMFDKKGNDFLLSKNIEILARDDACTRITPIMAQLEMCGASQALTARFRRKELVYKLLGEVYRIGSLPSLSNQGYPQIRAGVLLLEQSFLENLPVIRFAEASGVSISLFRSLFGKQYGMSPIQYRNRLRIDRAAVILSEGSCTVSEAAYACGFENIGYFCRCYKKITGETPLETKLRSFNSP